MRCYTFPFSFKDFDLRRELIISPYSIQYGRDFLTGFTTRWASRALVDSSVS